MFYDKSNILKIHFPPLPLGEGGGGGDKNMHICDDFYVFKTPWTYLR